MSREYSSAGAALDAVEKGVTFKAYCAKNRIGKMDFALASESLKYKSVLVKVLDRADVSAEKIDVGSQGMVLVMAYELLVGTGKIRGGGAVKRKIMAVLDSLKESLEVEMKENKAKTVVDLLPAHIKLAQLLPQFLRINTLRIGALDLSHKQIMDEILVQCPGALPDKDIPNLVVLPLKSPSFGQHPRVKDGCLIIQDKASCFPSQLLMDAWSGGDTIDACAAPGNKTSHAAMIMHQKIQEDKSDKLSGQIHAYDKNPRRAQLLSDRMNAAGALDIVSVENKDFLTLEVDDAKARAVRSVLLDPSCSGSGVARDLNRFQNEDESSAERLEKLRTFQIQAIKKAMSYPNVDLVLYSTCSIFEEENEQVVAEILNSFDQEGWRLQAPPRLDNWPRRGLVTAGLTEKEARCLIRCSPEDGLNGFFVAQFVKDDNAAGEGQKEGAGVGEVNRFAALDDSENENEADENERSSSSSNDEAEVEEVEENKDQLNESSSNSSKRGKKRKKKQMWKPLHKQQKN